MSLQMFHKRGKRGFTLVELLIVVAIIGVLSTIGVPTFRRMIQKSKKSEAKVNMGAIYTSEAAFFAEYNYYGNNLSRMGYEVEGNPQTLIYTVGFFSGSCVAQSTLNPSTGPAPTQINSAYPAYYTAAAGNLSTMMGQTNTSINNSVCAQATAITYDATTDGTGFTAGAVGMVAPGTYARTTATVDAWTMTNLRVLSNTQDGVQ